jgi:predicted PurR-regulated permease PerM
LLLLLVAVSVALVWILLPFYGPLLWSAIIALLFAPVHHFLLRRLRHRRTLAALLTTSLASLIAVVPFAILSAMLAHETAGLLARMQAGEASPLRYLHDVFDALPGWAVSLLKRFGLEDFEVLQRYLSTKLEQGSGFFAAQALSLGQNALEWAASLLITPYLAFFMIRDGERIVHVIRHELPLMPTHKQALLQKFGEVLSTTVRGHLLVAAIQGALGGVALWFFEVRGALLWAVVMAFLSLLPAIGAALVWLPLAIWFMVTGATWQAAALVAWGILVIGLVDNMLRPILVGRAILMPDYVVMITTLGGMVVFGINGFVLGPVIAAMFLAVWHLYLSTRQVEAPAAPKEEPELTD